jgi:RNA polymerase sigma factor (sigma-70 family)
VYYFDELIVSEIRKNNRIVLQELYKAHYPMVLHLICSNSGTEQEAKDIYQEAVIAFYEKVQQPDFVLHCKVKTFLYAVSRRLWLKRLWEKKRYRGQIEEGEPLAGVDEEMIDIEAKEQIFHKMAASLDELGDPCKSLLEAFYLQESSMESIRDTFGYSNTDTAKNQKYKCLQRLKKLFFNLHNPPPHES